jgi:hypothetical protein
VLARLALSRATRVALSLLIVVIAALLVWALLSDSGSGMSTSSNPKKSAASPAPTGNEGAGGAVKTPGEAPAETLRQRSLR